MKTAPRQNIFSENDSPRKYQYYQFPTKRESNDVYNRKLSRESENPFIRNTNYQFIYNNNGGTMNPFDGYIETTMTVAPSTYTLELQAGPNGEDLFTVSGLTTEAAEICGWMGVWDSGPTYTITELTEERLVLSALQQGGDCINPVGSGYFTLIFAAE